MPLHLDSGWVMKEIHELLNNNREYSKNFALSSLSSAPKRRLIVITCMDCRININNALGLEDGDANIIRNAGAIITEDVLRSLVISHHSFDTKDVLIIGHTNCGLSYVNQNEFTQKIVEKTGSELDNPIDFLGFKDLEKTILEQVRIVENHPWLKGRLNILGTVYDTETGKLKTLH